MDFTQTNLETDEQKEVNADCVAAKTSLELKKKYLLGEDHGSNIFKSASSSALDVKLKKFHFNITQCQKLLNPDCSTVKSDISKNFPKEKTYSQMNIGMKDNNLMVFESNKGRCFYFITTHLKSQ